MEYQRAYRVQCDHVEEVLASRAAGAPEVGRILVVEHTPVITVSSRPGAASNLVAAPEELASAGVAVERTDRGGDITYHGPGQLVVYPILDLNLLNLGLHAYMRLLEDAAIETCRSFGIPGDRDPGATGVWTGVPPAKVCAMGVRVRRWVSMHGLALNVSTDLTHFGFIVPCGLAGRPVTSLEHELGRVGRKCPPMAEAKASLVEALQHRIASALTRAASAREGAAGRADRP
jgi:lipoyl(octanoyl) transferase